MDTDTSLIRMVIHELSKKHGWNYRFTLDQFYTSKVCAGLSDESTGMFTFSPHEIVSLFDAEIDGNYDIL